MIAAILLLFLSIFGITPSDEELREYEQAYFSRVHHVFVEIGSNVDDGGFGSTFALGYEALVGRGGYGSTFEILGELVGAFGDRREWFLGVGGGHFVHPKIRIAFTGGPLFRDGQDVEMRGRLEMSGRFLVFSVAVQPYARVSATTEGSFDFAFGGRFEY